VTEAVLPAKDFVSIISSSFPELKPEMENASDSIYLQMMEFKSYALRLAKLDDDDKLRHCIDVLDRAVKLGDSDLKTAACVSFIEHIDRSNKAGRKLFSMLTPELRRVWSEMQDYVNPRGGNGRR